MAKRTPARRSRNAASSSSAAYPRRRAKTSRRASTTRSSATRKARPNAKAAKKAKSARVAAAKRRQPKRIAPTELAKARVDLGTNRLATALDRLSFSNKRAVLSTVKAGAQRTMELGPAYRHTFSRDRAAAGVLAEAYARTLADPLQQRAVFQPAVQMSAPERRTLVDGYRKAGQARGVVHAISQLPRAHGRLLMKDLLVKPRSKDIDHSALRDVLYWLRDAGAEVTRLQKAGATRQPRDEMDEAVIDFFEDVADEIANAITSVVDAVIDTVKSLGQALVEVINWAANDLANLVKALVEAGKTVLDLVTAALETGYELVRKVVGALDDIGTGLFNILDAAFQLATDALTTVLKAIDNLGRTAG